MKERSSYGIVIALALAGLFFAWSLADAIDRETDQWERETADKHWEIYRAAMERDRKDVEQ